MNTGRKTQMEKFEARMSKKLVDDHVIKEATMKRAHQEQNKSIIEKGLDVMKTVAPESTTGDIFAVVARDSMEAWMKLWNRTMEQAVRDTMKQEIRPIIREVIQEELQVAITGTMRGIQEAITSQLPVFNSPLITKEEIVKEVQAEIQKAQPEIVTPVTLTDDEIQEELRKDLEPAPVEKKKRRTGKAPSYTLEVITEMIVEAHKLLGNDIYKATKFCKIDNQHHWAYQALMKQLEDSGRGAWKRYVETVID